MTTDKEIESLDYMEIVGWVAWCTYPGCAWNTNYETYEPAEAFIDHFKYTHETNTS